MTDHDLRSLLRQVAAEPPDVRATSPLLPRLEVALQRAGLLGDAARLPELGRVLREAGLTRSWPEGDGPPETRMPFSACLTPEEAADYRNHEEEAMAETPEDERSTDPRDFEQRWVGWEPPPVGSVVCRHEWRRCAGYNYLIVEGAVTEPLLVRQKHGGCRTCECWDLNASLGWWRGHTLRLTKSGWVRGPELEVYRRVEPPWCLRPTDVVLG